LPALPITPELDGIRFAVRVTSRADRNKLSGVTTAPDGRALLHVRIAAAPVRGAANRALIAFISEVLQVRKSDVCIRSGETSKIKMLHVAGDSVLLLERARRWMSVEDL
jgi:uncharacterized protein (TIGR00251 family)